MTASCFVWPQKCFRFEESRFLATYSLLCHKVFWLTEEWASVAALRFSTFLYNWTKNQRTRNFVLFLANFGCSVTNLLTFCCSCTKLKLICALRPFLGEVIGAMALIPKLKPFYPISQKLWEPWSWSQNWNLFIQLVKKLWEPWSWFQNWNLFIQLVTKLWEPWSWSKMEIFLSN